MAGQRSAWRNTSRIKHENIIRSEIFSAERLEQHADSLAQSHVVAKHPPRTRLLEKRLRENDQVLRDIYHQLSKAIDAFSELPPAAEWLVDNYFVLEEQIRNIRNDLPPQYYLELPKLASGYLTGYPRVFGIAWAYIAHTDSYFSPELLERFIRAYQGKKPLNIGELWAVPITLGIALVENLRRAAAIIIEDRDARAEADLLADHLLTFADDGEQTLEKNIRAIDKGKSSSAFMVQLIQRLRDQDSRLLPLLRRLDERLHEQGTSAEEIVRSEHQNQGALTVTVRNIITTMRSLSTFGWVEFLEDVSQVDQQLSARSAFGLMDLPTRNLYRRAIERLSKRSHLSELEVTECALNLKAGTAPPPLGPPDSVDIERENDPGFYLIDKGMPQLQAIIGYRPTWRETVARANPAINFLLYIISNLILVALIIELGLAGAVPDQQSVWIFLALSCVVFFPASEAAITVINRFATSIFAPTILPGLALREGVPESLRTMVVVPILFGDAQSIAAQVEQLEVHYLSNADGDIRFGLLSDWKDAKSESLPQDALELDAAQNAIRRLNERHPMEDGQPRFYLFHRRRMWNERQGCWMGWERKRGKLHEFNRLLRGAEDTSFLLESEGAFGRPPSGVRYVVTLDGDTRTPRGTVKRLIGKLAHPLNRARIDPRVGYVVEGYGILQPRVASSLPQDLTDSFFQRVFYSASGIDPYAFASSDVYQDLFDEGSFTGKGIYDVDAFESALKGRIPDNTVLSHDLLEGIFARAALVSDVEVMEEFPSRYDVASSRHHRWTRGDWQLLPWIFGKMSDKLPGLGHWKMVDNLRRTLNAPFAFVALSMGWSLHAGSALPWTLLIVAAVTMPSLLAFLEGLLPRPGASRSSRLVTMGQDAARTAQQIILTLAFLPHQAWLMMDAVVRTLWRLAVSHRNLLEWVTSAESKVSSHRTVADFYLYMKGGVFLTALAIVCLIVRPSPNWPLASPFLILWSLAPAVAHFASKSRMPLRRRALDGTEKKNLRLVARSTWRFFTHFVNAEENYLPPDNFQEDPFPVVAHRTSPTNIGLYLLAIIAAQDFGWIDLSETLERLDQTFETLQKMERFRGHFYNWYDTQTLKPLLPRYISSVDSGNLAGFLLVVKQVGSALGAEPIVNPDWLRAVKDTLDLTSRALDKVTFDLESPTLRLLKDNLTTLRARIDHHRKLAPSLQTHFHALAEIDALTATVFDLASTLQAEMGNKRDDEVMQWVGDLAGTSRAHRGSLNRYASWLNIVFGVQNWHEKLPPDFLELIAGPVPLLDALPALCAEAEKQVQLAGAAALDDTNAGWKLPILNALRLSRDAADADRAKASALAQRASDLFDAMDFRFLLDETRQLLSIGYRVEDSKLDDSHYDLLASEARLASVVAIAKGDISAQNWFRLGRTVTAVHYRPALVSWSGSMFEYLMPSLVMAEPAESLIGQTNRMVVRRQMEYGNERGIPWGVSESAYSARDLEFTYQYSSFGVPGLGLKRGLSENIVIAPYATALAAMIEPQRALENLLRIEAMGGRGNYGWYEAIDFTSKRLPEGKKMAVVHAYMAHHQGMSLIAILNVLMNGRMRARFHAEPIIQATELLLQELPPRNVAVAYPRSEEVAAVAHIREIEPPNPRCFRTPHDSMPRTLLLSNGEYALMVTAAGSGYSQWRDLAVSRWREDITRDGLGNFIYIRDTRANKVWSATYQPLCVDPDSYEAAFFEDHAEFTRHDGTLVTKMNIAVSSEDNGEGRRVKVINQGSGARDIELTSYVELVLAQQSADIAHPAFSKLFVQTEFLPDAGALLATRRLRSPEEKPIWAVHLLSVEGEKIGNLQYETDRARFLGRGRTPRNPQSIDGRPLNDTTGTVLDPIFSLRCRLHIEPGATAYVSFWTLVTSSREEALALIDKYRLSNAFGRVAARAWTQAQLQYQHLGMTPGQAHLYQRLANYVLYPDRALRPSAETLGRGLGRQSILWPTGVSGDLPIVLMRVDVASDLKTLRQMVHAHSYWSFKKLKVDLVILNEQPTSYLQDLQNEIELLVRTSQILPGAHGGAPNGRIFSLRVDQISPEARALLHTVARAVIVGHRGSLAEQLAFLLKAEAAPFARRSSHFVPKSPTAPRQALNLEFFNGFGGFDRDGREYVVVLEPGQFTPAPWINVIANSRFGFQVSAEGAGYTWSLNSREYKLTSWSNDPVSDESSEVVYLRDLDNGAFWCPTATPIRKDGMTYLARHGFGYSEFETACYGIASVLIQFVPVNDSLKISRLTLKNTSNRLRRLSVWSYTEWVLGPHRASPGQVIATQIDPETGAMFAQNPWNNEFGSRTAFVHMSGEAVSWTADRLEFLGRNGALHHPEALASGANLSRRAGVTLDPCAVLQREIELEPGQELDIVILLGDAATAAEASQLIGSYQRRDLAKSLQEVRTFWENTLGRIQVRTPDRAMDIMQNGWLLYQTIACRILARSAFYQASGAYGYRDQLQDVMTLVFHHADETRRHLLRAASRQFEEGDVQHWWLPSDVDAGRGIRTRFSDDPLWLAYVACYYIAKTGDEGILDETVPYLSGPTLADGQHEVFFMPRISERSASLFEHCALAIDGRLGTGAHGLGLFGGGDWNDGMNRVGANGRGESVWLTWFLLKVIHDFSALAAKRDPQRVAAWSSRAAALKAALERDGWDGEWYRRGYYDDGTPLGSASSAECRIDSIAQSWSVISGAGEPERQRSAMKAVDQYLIKADEGIALLFTPPFDHTQLDPGYIKGYPAGIRENGGQYTHAAIWSVIALNRLGDGDKGFGLFSMLNPIYHANSRATSYRYKVEPYVVAADIYSNPQHMGRGGWTWYTGSAGWMYRAGLESVLGFDLQGSNLYMAPCIPKNWPGFEISYRYKSTSYLIRIDNRAGVNRGIKTIKLDGQEPAPGGAPIPLLDDGADHVVDVEMG